MNPRLLVPMIDGITTVMGRAYVGVLDPHGVIYYIDGNEYGKNNTCTVSCGGRYIIRDRGLNHYNNVADVLENRFDDYQYYQDGGS